MFRKTFAVLVVLLLFVLGDLFAQNAQELRFGSPVSGNIFGGREYWYSVRPINNGYVTVETTGNVDTFMHAYNSNREEIASDDDGGEGYNARITIPVSANQTYYFKVRGYSSEVGGPYRVVANFSAELAGGGAGMTSSVALQFDSPVSGNISSGGEYWYSVRPASNGYVTVETTGDTDTYMYAYYSNGEELDSNDDGGQGYNARITIFVDANQTYYFKVTGYSSSETGPYRIIANFSPASGGNNTRMSSSVPLQFNSPVPGSISRSGEYWYSVTPTTSGTVTVETTGYLDTYMYAYSSDNRELASNDDGGDDYNARITISVSAGQTYYFKVRGYSSSDVGPYSITAYFYAN